MDTGRHTDNDHTETQTLVVDFHFECTCERDGVADATGYVFANGAYLLSSLSSLCETTGKARAALDCWIAIAQPGNVSVSSPLSSHRLDESASKYGYGNSSGQSKTGPYSDTSFLETPDIFVVAGEPIVATITVVVTCSSHGIAWGKLDFSTRPWEINVPGVCITVKRPQPIT